MPERLTYCQKNSEQDLFLRIIFKCICCPWAEWSKCLFFLIFILKKTESWLGLPLQPRWLGVRCSSGSATGACLSCFCPSRVVWAKPARLVSQFWECCNIAVIPHRALSPCFHCSVVGAEPFCRCWWWDWSWWGCPHAPSVIVRREVFCSVPWVSRFSSPRPPLPSRLICRPLVCRRSVGSGSRNRRVCASASRRGCISPVVLIGDFQGMPWRWIVPLSCSWNGGSAAKAGDWLFPAVPMTGVPRPGLLIPLRLIRPDRLPGAEADQGGTQHTECSHNHSAADRFSEKQHTPERGEDHLHVIDWGGSRCRQCCEPLGQPHLPQLSEESNANQPHPVAAGGLHHRVHQQRQGCWHRHQREIKDDHQRMLPDRELAHTHIGQSRHQRPTQTDQCRHGRKTFHILANPFRLDDEQHTDQSQEDRQADPLADWLTQQRPGAESREGGVGVLQQGGCCQGQTRQRLKKQQQCHGAQPAAHDQQSLLMPPGRHPQTRQHRQGDHDADHGADQHDLGDRQATAQVLHTHGHQAEGKSCPDQG